MRCGSAKRISKVKVLGSCAVRVLNKQAKVRCFVPVWVYPSKDKMAWLGAVLSAMVGCKVKVLGLVRWWVLSKQARQGCGSIQTSKDKQELGVKFCAVRVPNKPSKGLVYLTTKSLVLWCGGRVRCGFILHPSFSLQGVRNKDNKLKLDIPYTLTKTKFPSE